MGWQIGMSAGRDIGYGVPAECDKPDCHEEIDRGISYCCGGYVTDHGCGLYFCEKHMQYRTPRGSDQMVELCPRCYRYRAPYEPKPDLLKWALWKLYDNSWATWRAENPDELATLVEREKQADPKVVKSLLAYLEPDMEVAQSLDGGQK